MKSQRISYYFALIGLIACFSVYFLSIYCQCISVFPTCIILMLACSILFFIAIKAQELIIKKKPTKAAKNFKEMKAEFRDIRKKQFSFFENKPIGLIILTFLIGIFVLTNFILFFLLDKGSVAIENGEYIIENRGKFIRVITEKEYIFQKSLTVRMMSGHFTIFYAISMLLLYKNSTYKKNEKQSIFVK